MTKTIKGSFDIKSAPLPADETLLKIGGMRMAFEKSFKGPLEAESVVAMIGLMNKEIGSGGYVALERVTGRLDGREGEFCLQHSSTMDRGKPSQTITVIPDSGTGELKGLTGAMTIEIVDGRHFYSFEYELA